MITVTPALLTLKTALMGFWDTQQAGKTLTVPPDFGLQKPGESLARIVGVYSSRMPGQLGLLWKTHGHSRRAKFESSCDLGFRLKKKWVSKSRPIP